MITNQLGALPLSPDILEKGNIGLWAFELDEGKEPRMYVDTPMLSLIGLKEQVSPEKTYRAWYDNIDKGSYNLVTDAVQKMTAGEHAEVQYPWHHPDGRTIIVRCGGVRNYNYEKGVRIEGTHQDVTEVIHLQEEKIAEQEVFNRYFLVTYESAYYINITSLTWQIYKRSDVLAENYPTYENYLESIKRYIDTEVHPADRNLAYILTRPDEIKDRLLLQESFSFTFRKVSEEHVKILRCEVVRGADQNHIALGFKDVTQDERARKEQEVTADLANQQRHIKSFGDMVNAALWSMDINDDNEVTDVYWSDECRRMFGFESTEDFPNTVESWSDKLHPDDKQATLKDFYHSLECRDTVDFAYNIKYRILRKNGEYCWYHAVGRMEYNSSGTRRMYGIITDISAEKIIEQQQEQLEQALAMSQSANKAKTTFLNNMSHDIRTPMNAIIGYTGLISKHLDNKLQRKSYIEKIDQSSSHLMSLINDVLDMSRIESGKMNLDEKPESIPDMIHALIDIVQADIRSKKHQFSVEVSGVKDETIVCDRLRLNQVLINILSNSVKYTPDGGVISMSICEGSVNESGYATYEFCIKDNGIGMSEDLVKNVFEPFTRGKNTSVSGIQGTGLGMAITKNIIEMMGGKIAIKSAPGQGTETIVTLDFGLAGSEINPYIIPEFDKTSALVVNSDKKVCMSVVNTLEKIGITAHYCTTGSDAVSRSETSPYKLYIVDWVMPDMSGIEITRKIRKTQATDSTIILSAYDWAEIEEIATDAGVNRFISNPLFTSDIYKLLCDCAGQSVVTSKKETPVYNFEGVKVLLVEDNEMNREIAEELLNECGFVVSKAEDGETAVEMAEAGADDYDLILMDIQMPGIDGYETTRRIRALPSEISKKPIIAMTANAFEEDRRLALKSGMNEHVTKPIDMDILKATIAKFL